jgi:hypothetical protein
MDNSIEEIVKKVYDREYPTEEEIQKLFTARPRSTDAGFIMPSADQLNRLALNNRAEVHA